MANAQVEIANRPSARAAAGALIGALVGALFATALVADVPFLRKAELASIDRRFAISPRPDLVADDLLVVTIDEPTVMGLEREFRVSWPPGRWFWADLIGTLSALGARTIVLDVAFSDLRDTAAYHSSDPFGRACEAGDEHCEASAEQTLLMAQEANASGAVVIASSAPSFAVDENPELRRLGTGETPLLRKYLDHRLPPIRGKIEPRALTSADPGRTRLLQYPEGRILAGVRSVGLANIESDMDIDGSIRRFAPVARVGDLLVPDLAVAAYAVSVSSNGETPVWSFDAPPAPTARPRLAEIDFADGRFSIGKAWLPVRDDGTSWIRWRGNWTRDAELASHVREALPLVLYRDQILLGEELDRDVLDPADFRDKVVFVGFTLQGEFSDRVNTPFGTQPGVFKHVSAYSTLKMSERLHSPSGWMDVLLVLFLSLLGGIAVLGLPDLRWQEAGGPVRQTAMKLLPGVLLLGGYGLVVVTAFHFGWIINVVHTSAALALSCLTAAVTAYVFVGREERRRREQVHAMLNRAFSPEVASVALEREERGESVIGGQKYDLTLYFSDIAGFTGISEKLSPEELVRILNEYLTRVTELLDNKHGANVDKYIGDAVMAFWGAPLPSPDGPVHACLAALDAMAVMDEYSRELAGKGLPVLSTRIGINTGPAVAGFIGHPDRPSYTALGDTVNLAARLEGANKAYGSVCMVGPETYERAKHAILARELDLVRVKGKKIPVRVYELIGRAEDPLPERREIKRRYEAALARYRSRDFQGALEAFLTLAEEHRDPASTVMAGWCRQRLEDPPADEWDGSNTLTEK